MVKKAWSEFEQKIENTNDWYKRNGIGTVEKIPNGTMTKRVNGHPVIVPTNKTGCDFIGHIKGIPIAFDAKSTENKTSFPFGSKKSPMVKEHQKEFLKSFKNTGGQAYLMIQFNKLNKVFLVDIDVYLSAELKQLKLNKKSFPLSFFEGMEVPERLYFLDYAKLIIEV